MYSKTEEELTEFTDTVTLTTTRLTHRNQMRSFKKSGKLPSRQNLSKAPSHILAKTSTK